MRLCVLSLLLLAAVLASGLGLPAAAPEPEYLCDEDPADCELMKKVFCSRASWVSDNDLLRSWQIVPDHIGQVIDLHGHFDSDESSDKWKHLELQTSPENYDDNYEGHIRTNDPDLSGTMMMYVLNKDVLIENEKAYFVYDCILASTNPFVVQRYSLICFHKYMTQTTQYDRVLTGDKNTQGEDEIKTLNAKVENIEMQAVFQKRQDSDMGQTEVPDILFFDEEQNGDVKKKLFSFWSRLQGLSPRGRTLPARRQAFVYYGPDGGPLSAEPRAARPRPPGQPLRWG